MTTPLPEGPTSATALMTALSLPPTEETLAESVAAAVNSLVRGWLRPAPDGEWDPKHVHGALMLATRLYRRKDTPAGVLQFGMEGAAYVQRNDPDVAQLLEMGAYTQPRVG